MRRLLNLNQSSMVFVKVIGFLVVLIPAILYSFVLIWNEIKIIKTLFWSMIKVSLVVGAFLFIVFLILIVLEQIQDHYFDDQYKKHRSQKVSLANGYYECQYCGNQRVGENDKTCNVCGKEFGLAQSKKQRPT
jgi:predicted membrane protein